MVPVLAPLLGLSADAQGYHMIPCSSPDTLPPHTFPSALPLIQTPGTESTNARDNQKKEEIQPDE